ncbi:MAG: MvaI/BcnI family restriction endonuclease, partial [Candidatus Thorarchaeota archaeon]|nr:MvaI/BcnI family restriction endonuclease [Candidatus Thorarchaeota archaeon]
VKSKRMGAKNNVSLTTKVPIYINNMSARDFTNIYGYKTETGKGLHCTLKTQKRNSRGWQLIVKKSQLDIDYEGSILGSISLTEVKRQFENKMNQMVFVIAESEMRGKWEFFDFQEAYLYTDIAVNQIKKLLKTDELVFEFRMRWKNGEFKDYGPAYRISEDNIYKLYLHNLRIM